MYFYVLICELFWLKKQAPDGACFGTAISSLATAAEAVPAAEARDKENPDNPFATAIIISEDIETIPTATIAVITTIVPSRIAGITIAKTEKNKNPNPVAEAIPTATAAIANTASARIITATISSSQVTHFKCLHSFVCNV